MTEHKTQMFAETDFLEHYGVKGMKWGKRKSGSSKSPVSADAARVNKIKKRVKKHGLDNLSNDELAKLNKRNQLVAEYKKQNPNLAKKGYKATKDVLAVVGTVSAAAALGAKVVKNENVRNGAKTVAAIVKNK